MVINSSLYKIRIWHKRQTPAVHEFYHDVFMFYLDLDELSSLDQQFSLLGYGRRKLYEFRDSDHISIGYKTAKENVLGFIKQQGVEAEVNKVYLLTNLRFFNYVFNPVSFYFCFDKEGCAVCAVCEIGNTFGELKYFFLPQKALTGDMFSANQVKHYYISPFTDMDNVIDFKLKLPDSNLSIIIDVFKNGQKFFLSSMMGTRLPLTKGNLWRMTLLFPFVTLKVIFLIHWHAAVLHFVKKVSHHAKDETKDLQRDVYRPWRGTSKPMSKLR